ncbi:e3 ubiquitin-protein ligase RNF13 [Trichonephila clavipes]|nr:e3 ubiquitin-protein ligase RNF13 [Trichonephila clavipes]
MAPHTIAPAVETIYRCKKKAELRRSPRGLHTRTRLPSLLRLNLDSSLKTAWFHSVAVQFPRAHNHSKRWRQWAPSYGSRSHRGPSEGATCAWMAADEHLVVRVHFLRCGGLLDDWSVEGVLSLVLE